ncbi:hypothetical protein CC2G_008592 [Coprinopsis cinerea AmutBmut pab1-1]|nr:hypothetical protein CC2G_008592 [Coprinopsis cinerea AmutBmut pab1-1]
MIGTPSPDAPSNTSTIISSISTAKTAAQTSEQYFFRDIIFRADDELFKVPALYFLTESQFFRDMFDLPNPEGSIVDSTCKDKPLVLEGVRASELSALLRVMYPPTFREADLLSKEEWAAVLKLADMWQMKPIKALAVEHLVQDLSEDPVTRVVLGKKHHVPEWIIPAYKQLIKREEPISPKDLEGLGVEIALKICAMRESCSRVEYPGGKGRAPQTVWSLGKSRPVIPSSEDLRGLDERLQKELIDN